MRMKLHLDTKIGETVILPIYEIDYPTATQTAGYSEMSNGTFGDGSKYNKFQVSNNQGAITDFLSANVPRIMDDNNTNCLFPYRLRYTAELGGYYYPITWFDDGAFTKLETVPTDWTLSYKYLKYQTTENARQLFSPHDAGNNGSVDQFTANNCYTDNNRTFIRKYVTESNSYFVCGQGYGYGGYGSYAILYPLCMSIGIPTTGSPYNNSNGFYFHDTAGNALNIGIIITGSNTHDIPQGSTLYSTGYARTPIFVHYVKDNTDFYGVAVVSWSSFESDNFPTSITVLGISQPFWGDSIISGGESGAGSWGSNTIPTVNDGTFSSTSDSVTPDNPNYSPSAIKTNVNTAISGLFSSLLGSYGIYMIDTVSQGAHVFDGMKQIMNVLYDDSAGAFLKRYEQSMYNPLSAVVACHLLPYQFAASALFNPIAQKKLTLSGYDVSAHITGNPDFTILQPLGYKKFPELPTGHTEPYFFEMPNVLGGFADFAPYTQCILHLPFIGAVELKTNAIAHGKLTVEYTCDIISGNVTASICCVDNENNAQYVASASGNCAYNIPLFSMNQNGDAVGKMLSGAAGMVSGALTGNPVGIATGAASIVGAAVESSFSPRSTNVCGNFGGNNMLMSPLDIWLEIVRPYWTESEYFQKLNGIPSGMSNTIADCGTGVPYDGYIEIEKIDLDNVPCTEQEKQEIEQALKTGVFLRGNEIL